MSESFNTGEFSPREVLRNPSSVKNFLSIDKSKKVKEKHLTHDLQDMFRKIFLDILLINPKKKKVLICVNIYINKKFKKSVTNVLSERFKVKNIDFLCNQVCSLFGCGSTTNSGLIIDCGYEETRVVPFCFGNIVTPAVTIIPLGGKVIIDHLKNNLKDQIKEGELSDEDLEDILLRVCFCDNKISTNDKSKKLNTKSLTFLNPKSVKYITQSKKEINVSVENRTQIFDILFAGDEEGFSVVKAILDSIIKCKTDTRRFVISNIILTGGISDVVGFSYKLFTQISFEFENNEEYKPFSYLLQKMRISKTDCPLSYISFLGASVFSTQQQNFKFNIVKENKYIVKKNTSKSELKQF